jgi:hypothetical protein
MPLQEDIDKAEERMKELGLTINKIEWLRLNQWKNTAPAPAEFRLIWERRCKRRS